MRLLNALVGLLVLLLVAHAATAADLVRNGGFEDGIKGWYAGVSGKGDKTQVDIGVDAAMRAQGKQALRITNKSDALVAEASGTWFPLQGDQRYVLSFSYKTAALSRPDATSVRVLFHAKDKRPLVKEYFHKGFKKSDDWLRIDQPFVAPAHAVRAYITFFTFYRTGTLWLDDVRVAPAPLSDDEKAKLITEEGVTFFYKPRRERPEPAMPALAGQQGFVTFVRANPRDTYPDSVPTTDELAAPVEITATPGEYEPGWFSVRALRDLRDVRVELAGDFTCADGAKLPKAAAEVRVVKCWPQRTGWKTREYYVIPELLEPNRAVHVPAHTTQSFYFTIHVPDDAKPGAYRTTATVSEAGAQRASVTLNLRVLPFKLRRPTNRYWMLYYRFSVPIRKVSNETLEADLRLAKACGINALWFTIHHLGSLGPCRFDWEGQRVTAFHWPKLERIQAVRKAIGLRGPLVISDGSAFEYDHARKVLPNIKYPGPLPLDDERLKLAFGDAVKAIDKLVKRTGGEGYSDWIFEGVDEPGSHPKLQPHSLWQLSLAKAAGAKTYATMWGNFARTAAPHLSIQCYSTGYSVRSAEFNAARTAECKQDGNRYWYYGSGCYTNQEGGLMPNRLITGLLLFKSGAEGSASWIYQAAKKDAYNDFDANNQGESKDAMIVYPSPNGPVPTLQWEGIREGIDDYAYLWTLAELIREAPAERRAQAQQALERIVAQVPWTDEFSRDKFDNAAAQRLRREVIEQILQLAK